MNFGSDAASSVVSASAPPHSAAQILFCADRVVTSYGSGARPLPGSACQHAREGFSKVLHFCVVGSPRERFWQKCVCVSCARYVVSSRHVCERSTQLRPLLWCLCSQSRGSVYQFHSDAVGLCSTFIDDGKVCLRLVVSNAAR